MLIGLFEHFPFQKFFSVTRTIFLTAGQNDFGNKIPFLHFVWIFFLLSDFLAQISDFLHRSKLQIPFPYSCKPLLSLDFDLAKYILGFNTLIQVANKNFESIRTAQMNVTRCISRVLKYLKKPL